MNEYDVIFGYGDVDTWDVVMWNGSYNVWMASCFYKEHAKLVRRALLKSEYPELFTV